MDTPGDYSAATSAIAATLVLCAALLLGVGFGPAIVAASVTAAIMGIVGYVVAKTTNAPANEFVTDVSDATGGALLGTNIGVAMQAIPAFAVNPNNSILNFLSQAAPSIRGIGQKLAGATVLFQVLGLLVGTAKYSDRSQGANHVINPAPGNCNGYFVTGGSGYSVCTAFNGGSQTCWNSPGHPQ